MSFAMESLQMYIPPRVASPLDLAANAVGAMLGGLVATALARNESTRDSFYRARARLFLPGHLGDVGLALMLLWLVAQTNPGIPLFAVTFDSDLVAPAGVVATAPPLQDDAASAAAHESASTVVQAAGTAFQVLGVGLFAALLLRRRRNTGTIVVALIVGALFLKGVAAAVMLKPAIWQSWFKPGALIGIPVGAVLLLIAIALPRPVQVALCAIALLSSLGAPVLAPETLSARAPLAHLRLALRATAELQRLDARGAARLAAADGRMAVRARRPARMGQTGRSDVTSAATARVARDGVRARRCGTQPL